MDQTTARRLAKELNENDPSAVAVATTADAQAGRWETTNEWVVTTVNGRTYYEPPAEAKAAAKVRISRRVFSFLQGTQAWHDLRSKRESREGEDVLALMRKLHDAPSRKDGSSVVEIDADEAEILLDYLAGMEAGGSDNAWEPDGLADLNAARAAIRKLHEIRKESGR